MALNLIEQPKTDIGDLIKEMDQPKQSFPMPDAPADEEIDDTEPKPSKPTTKEPDTVERDTYKIARRYFRIGDIPLTQITSWIAGEPAKRFALPKDDQEYIIEVLKDLVDDEDLPDPKGWLSLLVLVIFLYGGNIKLAIDIRKEKKAIEANEKKEKELTRLCPDCNAKITYASKQTYLNAIENNSRCSECAAKI